MAELAEHQSIDYAITACHGCLFPWPLCTELSGMMKLKQYPDETEVVSGCHVGNEICPLKFSLNPTHFSFAHMSLSAF